MKQIRRGPSLITILTLLVLMLIVGTGLTLGSLWAMGIDLRFWAAKTAPQPTGFPVPVLARPLPAYTKIKLEHFIDAKSKEPTVRYLPSKEEAESLGFTTKMGDILGRVLTRDKDAGFPFVEKDLFPKDTRAGVVAGIPPGKRAFVLAADKVQGVHSLKVGDRFDLLGSMPVDLDKAMAKLKSLGVEAPLLPGGKRANVRVLVQNGAVVLPVAIREIPTGSPSMAKGGKVPTKPVQEVTIAIDPEEVAVLHEALAIQATLMCVGRSGHPDEAKSAKVIVGSSPEPRIHQMEVITSKKRQVFSFPDPGKGPRETAMNEDDSRDVTTPEK